MKFKLNPSDVEKAAKSQGVTRDELNVPSSVILTFSNFIMEYFLKKWPFQRWKWKGENFSPYTTSKKSLKGLYRNQIEIAVFFPPMGASPLVSFCEELIFFGARNIILICASWSLGEKYLQRGQFHLPNFAIGLDGTSPHYNNKEGFIEKEPKAYNVICQALKEEQVNWKEGGVGACEAIYRITDGLVNEYRNRGCLSMENGEVASLYSLAKVHKIPIGVLLQPYLDVEDGWNFYYIDDTYKEMCKIQARVAIKALERLWKENHRNI